MNGFIYIIRNTVNDKVYMGQTRTSVDIRWREHLRHAQYGTLVINRAKLAFIITLNIILPRVPDTDNQ